MDPISILSQAVNLMKTTINCPICFDVLSDPVSTKCNHHFCSECFKKLFNSRRKQNCPVCHTSLTRRSCAKNIGSLNQIVDAVKNLIQSLVDDTGIDFSEEITIPSSSREATCQNEIVGQPASRNKQISISKQHEKEKSQHASSSKDKNRRQYHGKTRPSNMEDSFLFPADFIHPSKEINAKSKDPMESTNTKVSSWLTKNENDLIEQDEMSILNGSLPKKIPVVDLNLSSEEELLSVSQVDTELQNCKSHLAPLKLKSNLEIISEQAEDEAKVKTKSPEFKDPYEFISSQNSNQGWAFKKPLKKRNTRSYGSKKKPLGLDISRLVNEPYIKKKKLEINESIFEVPVRLDDTFDQLFTGNKHSRLSSSDNKETVLKGPDKMKSENKVLIFQSQGSVDNSVVLSDFSSGSDDDWAPTKPKRLHKTKQHINDKVVKPRMSKVKTILKSGGNVTKKKKEYEREIENLNKTFEEVESHKLVTSSQVMREETARKQECAAVGEKFISEEICMEKDIRKDNIDEQETEMISCVEENNSIEERIEHSNHSRKETKNGIITSTKIQETSDKKIKQSVHKSANILCKSPKVVLEDIETILLKENKCVLNTKQKQLLSMENSEHQIQNNVQECLAEHLQSPVSSGRNINPQSPETPVKYFNLSQSEERAKIMGEFVKSLESSIKEEEKALQMASSGDSKISVSVPTLPDEDERLVEKCISNVSSYRERSDERLEPFSDLNTPASVSFTCGTLENANNKEDKPPEIPGEDVEISNEGFKISQKGNTSLQSISNSKVTENVADKVTPQQSNERENLTNIKERLLKFHTSDSDNKKNSVDKISFNYKFQLAGEECNSAFSRECILDKTSNNALSNQKNTSGFPRKGILVVKNAEERMSEIPAKVNARNEEEGESLDRIERRVHFAETPLEEKRNSLQHSSTGQKVLFLKAGSCFSSYSRPRVPFLYLGICMSKAEREHETDQWIIKVSKTFPVCFCRLNSEKSPSVESSNKICDQHSTSLKHVENEEKKLTSHTEENDKLSCEPVDTVRKLHVGNSAYEDIQIHSESNVNYATCSDQKLKPYQDKSSLIEEKMNNNIAENIQKFPCMKISNLQIPTEKLSNSDILKNIQRLPVRNDHTSVDKLDLIADEEMSGKDDVNNGTSPQQSLRKASGEDVFTSCQNSGMQGSLNQKVSETYSKELCESEEHNGILPYQKPQNKISSDVEMYIGSNKDEFSSQKCVEKQSDEDIFFIDQKVEGDDKISVTNNEIKNNNAQQSSNGICSTDEDIFQSNEIDLVPPFQVINSSGRTKESQQENNISLTVDDVSLKVKKTSINCNDINECDGAYSSNKSNLKAITGCQLTPSSASICLNSDDIFKTEGNTSETSVQSSENKTSNFTFKNLKSNDSRSSDLIGQPDLKTSVNGNLHVDKTPERSRRNWKRTRSLIESSDDSDNEEKVVKKFNSASGSVTSEKICSNSSLQPKNCSEKTLSKMDTQNILNTEDEDCLLNSEELLQRVIDNINEDLGNTKKRAPKLRGAKKKISSDSEDDFMDCDAKDRKLSKSPEYEHQDEIDLTSDQGGGGGGDDEKDDDDVFNDNGDNDIVDIIECTPTKNRTEDKIQTEDTSEKMDLPRATPEDIFEKQSQGSTPKKFVFPHSTNLNSQPKNEVGNVSHDGVKKSDQLISPREKRTSDNITLMRTKESNEQINVCNSPRKAPLETVGKSPLKMRLGSSQSNQKNIQKSVPENSHKPFSSISKDLKAHNRKIFVCSGLTGRMVAIVKKFANEIGAGFSDNFTMSMTHLIVNVDENQATPKTLKYLQAVAAKKWVVSFNWITACISSKRLLPEENFEAIDTVGLDGPRRSRLSSESLFKNVQACFIEPFQNITVDKLQEIFMMCGGMVVDSPEGFSITSKDVLRIIIVDNDAEIKPALCQKWISFNRAVTLNYDWLVDCIGSHTILPLPSSFAIPFTREQVLACGIPEYLLDEDDMEITEMSDISCLPQS